MQSFELENLQALCNKYQALRIDQPWPKMPRFPVLDVVVNSLTKWQLGGGCNDGEPDSQNNPAWTAITERTQDLISNLQKRSDRWQNKSHSMRLH